MLEVALFIYIYPPLPVALTLYGNFQTMYGTQLSEDNQAIGDLPSCLCVDPAAGEGGGERGRGPPHP